MPSAFSTCWNSSRHKDGGDVIREILDLGFKRVELSHGMNVSLLPGIRKAFEQGLFEVTGLHNFCPSPVEVMIDAPDCYEYTSHKPHVRERAFRLTLKTIEFAAEFDARYVVLHLGSVPMRRRSALLEHWAGEGRLYDREYVREKLTLVRERERKGSFHFQRARETVARLAEVAAERNVVLAIESRSAFEDVPTEREMTELMEEFADNPAVGYWHDFGHVQRKHNIGLLDHAQWLERMLPYLVGCHVHDVEWPDRDHRVPLTGDMGLENLLPLVPEGLPMVWELSPGRRRVQIRRAKEAWDRIRPDPVEAGRG